MRLHRGARSASKPIRYVLGDERDPLSDTAPEMRVTPGTWRWPDRRPSTTLWPSRCPLRPFEMPAPLRLPAQWERWSGGSPNARTARGITKSSGRTFSLDYDEIIVAGKKTFKVTKIYYTCPGCGCISDEVTMKRAPAKWEADNPAAYEQGTRSFWLNAFCQPVGHLGVHHPEVSERGRQLRKNAGGLQHLLRRAMGGTAAIWRTRTH